MLVAHVGSRVDGLQSPEAVQVFDQAPFCKGVGVDPTRPSALILSNVSIETMCSATILNFYFLA